MPTFSTLPRDVAQTLITKLDLNHISPKAAKEHALRYYGIELQGRTRDQVARDIGRKMERPA